METITRHRILLGLLLILIAGVLLVDLHFDPGSPLPASPYALAIVIAAWALPPRMVAGIALFAAALQSLAAWLQQPPVWLFIVYMFGIAFFGLLGTALSARSRREAALTARSESARARADAVRAEAERGRGLLEEASRQLREANRQLTETSLREREPSSPSAGPKKAVGSPPAPAPFATRKGRPWERWSASPTSRSCAGSRIGRRTWSAPSPTTCAPPSRPSRATPRCCNGSWRRPE